MHPAFRVGGRPKLDKAPPVLTAADAPRTVRFTNCRLLRDHALVTEDLCVRGGVIIDPKRLFWEGGVADETVDCQGMIIAPGYIDVQLNGGFGADFSTPEGISEALTTVAKGVLPHGVTAFLPTIICSKSEAYRAILPHIVPRLGSKDGAAILGVHLEGPFLSPHKPGCHPPENLREPGGEPGALRRACGDHLTHVKLVTLAPELHGADMLIAELKSRGVVVAAGHSMATIAQLEASQEVRPHPPPRPPESRDVWKHASPVLHSPYAPQLGVTMCTHLFNAMPAFTLPEPGLVGVLGSTKQPAAYFGLIADGIHVHPASLKIAVRREYRI